MQNKLIEESKLFGERIQETTEKTSEKLSEEHDYLKESNNKFIITLLKEMVHKVSSCNIELEKKLRQIFPDYEVSH